ncbi:hypothetical protein OH492_27480 [Vibrio chagasii]|nr:hypothetical protein [Vibrio chagasii]
MGYGGPHAAFMATREKHWRAMRSCRRCFYRYAR